MSDPSPSGGGLEYRLYAPLYDAVVDPLLASLRKIGLEMAGPGAGEQALDIGCGTGMFLSRLAALGCQISGVDLSPAMVAQARKRLGPDAQLHVADATAMPLEAQNFDVVSAIMTLHEMDPEVRLGVLREAARVCRPGGRVLLVDFHPGQLRSLKGRLRRAMTFTIELCAGRRHFGNYRRFMRAGGLPPLLAQVGLQIEKERYVGQGNFAVLVATPR